MFTDLPDTVRALPASTDVWRRRFFIVLTILGSLTLAVAIAWGIGKIITPLVLLGFSVLLAYLLFPLVRFFQRHMPRALAILLSLVVVLAVLVLLVYFVVFGAIQEFGQLISAIQEIVQHPEKYPAYQAFLNKLQGLGVTQNQAQLSGQQIVGYLQQAINGIVPIVGSIFVTMLSLLMIATLAVYFIVAGPRITNWCRHKTPLKYRGFANRLLDDLDHSVGGYVRGQVLLAVIMGAVVGIGAFILGVPYIFLLAVIVFVCEFIPQIGAYISAAIGVGFALTQGWQTALIYAIFVAVMQGGLDGQVLSPRVIGHSVGLHPILSVFALLVGTALFGLLGAFFACPAAAILQDFVLAFWHSWRERHPDQFPTEEQERKPVEVTEQEGHGQPGVST